MQKRYGSLLAAVAALLIGLDAGAACPPGLRIKTGLDQAYLAAVADARTAEASEIYDRLTVITRSNKALVWDGDQSHLLILTWTAFCDRYRPGATLVNDWDALWVTVVPDMKRFFSSNDLASLSDPELALRLKQVLGVPPGVDKQCFVELWARPEDMFRPAPDNEIDDATAGLKFPASATDAYKKWFNDSIIGLYYADYTYPWTRLGYTYDWGNPDSHVGLSEFVVRKGSTLKISSVAATRAYFNR